MLRKIFDFLLPETCHLCDSILTENERFICGRCEGRLPRTYFHLSPLNRTTLKLAGFVPFEKATSHFFYSHDSEMAILIHDFKYRNYPSLALRLGEIMGEELRGAGYFSDIDIIIPLPIHWTKRMSRGYNQTEYLAEGISRQAGIQISTDLRVAKRRKSQTQFSDEDRRKINSALFRLRHPERYKNLHILLVDDVCTTGATLVAAARAILRDAPGARISLATLSAAT